MHNHLINYTYVGGYMMKQPITSDFPPKSHHLLLSHSLQKSITSLYFILPPPRKIPPTSHAAAYPATILPHHLQNSQ